MFLLCEWRVTVFGDGAQAWDEFGLESALLYTKTQGLAVFSAGHFPVANLLTAAYRAR